MILKYSYFLASPLKGLAYFFKYHRLIENMSFQRHFLKINVLKTINCIYFIKSLHFLYLGTMSLSNFQRALHFDALYFMFRTSSFDAIGVIFVQWVILMNNNIFLTANYQLHLFLINLFQKNNQNKKLNISKFYQLFLKNYKTKIKKYYLIILNTFISTVVFIGLIFLIN